MFLGWGRGFFYGWVGSLKPKIPHTHTSTHTYASTHINSVLPVRVLVDVELRQTLRLTRREKKARLFLPRDVKDSLEAFLDHVYQVRDSFLWVGGKY